VARNKATKGRRERASIARGGEEGDKKRTREGEKVGELFITLERPSVGCD